jgi:hypothetical protein
MKRLLLAALLVNSTAFGQGFNIPVGQEPMALSIPVVIASDQSPVPVSGTFSDPSVGATGAAVPASATYAGMTVAGILTGLTGTANGLKVDGSAVTQPISGSVSVSNFPSTAHSLSTTVLASNNYSSTNVTTAAYVQLIASTSVALTSICVSDTSGSIIKIATGAAASEVDKIYLQGGGTGCYDVAVPSGTRISLRALDVNATTGFFLFTCFL